MNCPNCDSPNPKLYPISGLTGYAPIHNNRVSVETCFDPFHEGPPVVPRKVSSTRLHHWLNGAYFSDLPKDTVLQIVHKTGPDDIQPDEEFDIPLEHLRLIVWFLEKVKGDA